MIERRWIQKGYRIFFAIALLICVGGIPAYAEELVPDAGEITGRVLSVPIPMHGRRFRNRFAV